MLFKSSWSAFSGKKLNSFVLNGEKFCEKITLRSLFVHLRQGFKLQGTAQAQQRSYFSRSCKRFRDHPSNLTHVLSFEVWVVVVVVAVVVVVVVVVGVEEVILFNVDLDKGCTVVIRRQGRLKFWFNKFELRIKIVFCMFKGMRMAIQIYNGSLTVKLKFCAWQSSVLNPQHLFL